MKEWIVADEFVDETTKKFASAQGKMCELIRCKDCKHWDREDGTFKDFDGKEWHECKELDVYTSASGEVPVTPSWFYCGYGERK